MGAVFKMQHIEQVTVPGSFSPFTACWAVIYDSWDCKAAL